MHHIVSLSGGWDSTAMALELRQRHPEIDFTWICTPTANELPPMWAHWRRLGELLGKPLLPVMADTGFVGLCERKKGLPSWRMRFCTPALKLAPTARFLMAHTPCVNYVGLRADEEMREGARRGGDFLPSEFPGIETRYPLREWGWDRQRVVARVERAGIDMPTRTDCAWCFYQTLSEWYELWLRHPDTYAEGEEMEQKHGHTFRSPSRDTQPASLRELRLKFEAGYVPKARKRKTMCSVCER